MHTCSNCASEFNGANEGVVVSSQVLPISAICDTCLTGARVIKLVLRKGDIGGWKYEQYTAIETSGGLNSSKRVG
jgi:hypothetical protein